MAGYDDTYQMIINTLMGRPNGSEIQPEAHQAYALNMLKYIRSLELVPVSSLIGAADENTVPIQPDDSKVAYLSGIGQNSSITFNNFIGQDGQALTVTSGDLESFLIILLWNAQYWSYEKIPSHIISQADKAFYNFNIKKTYSSVSEMNSDKADPVGTDGNKIRLGDIVSVVNDSNPNEDGIYSYSGPEGGWTFQSRISDFKNVAFYAESEPDVEEPATVTVDRAVADGLGNNIPETYATKDEANGKITELENKTNNKLSNININKLDKPTSSDDSFEFTDKDNNVAFRIDSEGLKTRRYNIVSENGEVVYQLDEDFLKSLISLINTLNNKLSNININKLDKPTSSDDSFEFTDKDNNVAFRIDSEGLKVSTLNLVDKDGNIVSKVKKQIDGYVICDSDNNIVFRIDSDGLKARKYNLVNSAGDVVNVLDDTLFQPKPKKKVIIFNFDGTNNDSRPDILFKYGLQGTFAQASNENVMKKLIQQGHEICPYTNGCRILSYDEEGVQQAIDKLTTVFNNYFYKYGLYQPSTILCDGHTFSWPLKEALVRMDLLQYFRYIRCSTVRDEESNDTYPAYSTMDGNGYYLLPQGISKLGNNADEVITKIDDFIDNKDSQDGRQYLMLFMHNYLYDSGVNGDPWIDESAFEQIVVHVKTRVDNGDVLVKNLEQYYTYYHPQTGINDNLTRVRLAILNKLINSINN